MKSIQVSCWKTQLDSATNTYLKLATFAKATSTLPHFEIITGFPTLYASPTQGSMRIFANSKNKWQTFICLYFSFISSKSHAFRFLYRVSVSEFGLSMAATKSFQLFVMVFCLSFSSSLLLFFLCENSKLCLVSKCEK